MRRRLEPSLALVVLLSFPVATRAEAQVFFATRPNPQFAIGPLFVRADVTPDLGPVTVDVLWSLEIPPTRSALGLEQDLYLLWPSAVRGEATAATSDRQLVSYVSTRGFTVRGEGHLALFEEDLYPPPGAPSERLIGRAPFVTFSREGLGPLGRAAAASYIRIPWTPALTNRTRLVRLRLQLDGLIRPRPATWIEDALRGPRHLVSLGFNDVRDPTVFPFYLENRARLVHLADEPSQLLVRFAGAERLRIDDISPRSGSHEPSGAAPGTEVVSLFLETSEGRAPQVLTVQFGYGSRLQAWVPILIPIVFFVLGRATGPLVERLVRRVARAVAARVHVGRSGKAGAGRQAGVILGRDTLGRIVPGRTTYDEVLGLCGRDVREEKEDLATPDRRILIYRGRRVVPQGRRGFRWLATVSHWETEDHEVEFALEQGLVRDVQVRVRRMRSTYPGET